MMKKFVILSVVALVLVFMMVGVASANGGPHGGYTATTDACAGCHRAHTATGAKLLVSADTTALCKSCHGTAGSGANTNVDDGFYLSTRDDAVGGSDVGGTNTADNAPLLGGGFLNYGGTTVSSSHDVSGVETDAWGFGGARGASATMTDGALDCASCHDPHGNTNYRILSASINGATVTVAQVDEDPAAKDYGTEQWGAGTSDLCAACHGAYHQTGAGVGSDATEAANGGYTHRVDVPWNGDGTTPTYVNLPTINPETTGMDGNGNTYTLPLAETNAVGGDKLVCSENTV